MAMEVPRSRVRVLFAATASGRNESCLVSLVQSPAKPRDSAAWPTSSIVGRCFPSTARLASSFMVSLLGLGDQDQLAGGLAAFEVAVRLVCLGELVGAADTDVEVILPDPGEEALRPPEEFLAGRGVVGEGGAGEVQTTLLVENLGVKRWHGAARGAEENHVAAGFENVSPTVEGVLAYAIVDHVDAFSVCDAICFLDELLFGVDDHLVRPRAFCELRLLLGASGAYNGRAAQLGDLAEQEPDASGCRVYQCGMAFLQGEGAVGQVVGRHSLEHNGRRHSSLYEGGIEGDEPLSRGDDVLGVGPRYPRKGHVVSLRDLLDPLADGLDLTGPFETQGERRLPRVEAGALVGVYKVHPGRRELDARLALARFGNFYVLVVQDLRPAMLVHPDSLHPAPFVRQSPLNLRLLYGGCRTGAGRVESVANRPIGEPAAQWLSRYA